MQYVNYKMQTCQECFSRLYSQLPLAQVIAVLSEHHCCMQQNQELSEPCLGDDLISFQHQPGFHQMTLVVPRLLYTLVMHSSF